MSASGNYTALVSVQVSDRELKSQLEKVGSKVKPIDIKVKVDSNGLKDLNKDLKDTSTNAKNYNKAVDTATQSTKNLGRNASDSAKGVGILGSKFVDITKKVFEFGMATKVIGLFETSVREAVQTVFDFDDALTEFKKVSDLSGESLNAYTEKLGEMGTEVARTRKHCCVYI